MKNIVFTLAATVLIAGILLTGCNSPSQNNENADDNMLNTQSDFNLASQDSINEYQQFKADFQDQIRANEKTIADLKESIEDASQENKDRYEEKLAELEEKNNDLKMKLAEYKDKERDSNQWQNFKTEFKREMDELGNEFSDFTDDIKE